jgi:hypothetical protein
MEGGIGGKRTGARNRVREMGYEVVNNGADMDCLELVSAAA